MPAKKNEWNKELNLVYTQPLDKQGGYTHFSRETLFKARLVNLLRLTYNSTYMNAKNIVIIVLLLVLASAVAFLFMKSSDTIVENPTTETETNVEILPVEPDGGIGDGAEFLPEETLQERDSKSLIGTSVDGSEIVAYHFGSGDTEILLVGGVHGGYSPNTSALAKEFVSYLEKNEVTIPEGVMVTVIPNLNPDGLTKSGAAGRFNSNTVDLNRNFDCEWAKTGVWRSQEVSGGDAPFSEPEAASLRDYVNKYNPEAAIVWFSAEGKVYPSACDGVPSKQSVELAATFATAAGYGAAAEFDAYAITGDMVNWMAKQDISAISVLLSDHQNTEWDRNLAGLQAVLKTYAE